MHPRSDNIKFASYNDVNEVVDELFESLSSRYQGNLEKSISGNDFIFGLVQLMYCEYAKVNFQRGGSYIDSPDCMKKETRNPKNTDHKCFQYVATVALTYEEIK